MVLKNLISGFVGILLVACVGQGVFIYHAHFLGHSPKTQSYSDVASTPVDTFKTDTLFDPRSAKSSSKDLDQGQSPLTLPGLNPPPPLVERNQSKDQEKGLASFPATLVSNQTFPSIPPIGGLDLAPPQNPTLPGNPANLPGNLPPVPLATAKPDLAPPIDVFPKIQPPLPNTSQPMDLVFPGLPQSKDLPQPLDSKPTTLHGAKFDIDLAPPGALPSNQGVAFNPQNSTPQLIPLPLEIPSGINQFVQIQQQLAQLMSPEELKKATEAASRQLDDRKKQKEKDEKEQNALAALEKARKALKQVSHDFPDTEAGKKATQYLQTLENKTLKFPELPSARDLPGNQTPPNLPGQNDAAIPSIEDPFFIPKTSNPPPKK